MNNKTFEQIVNTQLNYCKELLISKGIEYNGDEENVDRLHSFKTAAALQGISSKEALAGMMVKHTVSIYDMCKGADFYPVEKWIEKITDHINYLLLLFALVEEEASLSKAIL